MTPSHIATRGAVSSAYRASRTLMCVWMLCASGTVVAAELERSHQHPALDLDNNLTITMVLGEAIARYPSAVELEARAAQADAWTNRGRSLLADRPSLSFRYQTDRWNADNGLEEFESGIELPLWRWGQRLATQSLGKAMTMEATTANAALRWEVAGLVRSVIWEMALSANDVALADEAMTVTTRLTAAVERRYELGDVALSDALLSRTAQLEARTALTEAQATFLDAERGYRSLTMLERRPPFQGEALSFRRDIARDHPALAFADARIRRAETRYAVTSKAARGNPMLLIGPRRERPPLESEFEDSVGVTITVPFGGSALTATEVTAEAREVASARAERGRLMRALQLQMHEAAHRLDVVQENLAGASERADVAARHYAMGESAYEKGELDLMDLLRLQSATLTAKRQLTRLTIEQKWQTAVYNQAVGELP